MNRAARPPMERLVGELEDGEVGRVTYTFLSDEGGADDFAVARFEGVERLNSPYRYSIELAARDEGVDPHRLLGRGATLSIDREGHVRFVHGIVERVVADRVVADGHEWGVSSTAVLVPALVASRYTTNTRIFQDLSALDIVEQVLNEDLARYRRRVETGDLDRARFTTRNYCVQYQETNLDFVHRLLEEEGIGYHFLHDDTVETLVLFEATESLAPVLTAEPGPLRFEGRRGDHTTAEHVYRFATQTALTTRSVVVRDHDWIRGLPTLEASATSKESPQCVGESYEHGLSRNVSIHEDMALHAAGTAAAVAAALPHGMPLGLEHRVHSLPGAVLPPWTSNDVDKQAAIRAEGHRRCGRVFQGASHVTGLAPGCTFELEGGLDFDDDGQYYVTRVTHRGGVRASSGAQYAEYDNEFECLTVETAWRPDRETRKPRIQGVQTAKVTGPAGLDVHTDPLGRIKVIFNWDRASFDPAGNQTCWLRVGQVWAGQGAPGFSFIPRVGMEVIVTFVDGDPDRPLVIGCVNNATHPTPGMLPVQATKSVIRTRTVPHGAGHNEISFEDAAGMERVHIRAQRDLDELILNDRTNVVERHQRSIVRGDSLETVLRHKRNRVRGHFEDAVLGNRTCTTGSNHRLNVQGSSSTVVDGSVSLSLRHGSLSANLAEGGCLLTSKGAVGFVQDDRRSVQLIGDDDFAGIRIDSDGAKIEISRNEIRLALGRSTILVRDDGIQINNKTFPSE